MASKSKPTGRKRAYKVQDFYEPFPRQKEFHDSTAKYRLFGGAAGPGKTKALLYEAILQAHKHPGVDTLLLRRTFPELEASLITYFRRDVPRELYEKYNEAKHIATWLNGSTTRFAYCDTENDVYRYQGAEYLFIGVDELTHFTLKQWQFLTSRNRCRIREARPCMAGATNPGNIGHAWVKALWVDGVPAPGMDRPDQYDAEEYDFIHATIADNPYFANDVGYKKTLGQLPEALRRAFLDAYLSPDAFAQRTADASIADQLGDGLAAAGLPRPTPADNDRVGGWMLMYQALETNPWLIADNCTRLIENLPTLTRAPANVEDTLKCDGDDPADAARYGLKSALEPGRAPADVVAAERVTAVDPTSRAIWLKKISAEESRRVAPAVTRRWRPRSW